MTQQKNLTTLSLQDQLIHALETMLAIPGMPALLQPSIDALKDKSRIHVPENDRANIAKLFAKIKKHGPTIKESDRIYSQELEDLSRQRARLRHKR